MTYNIYMWAAHVSQPPTCMCRHTILLELLHVLCTCCAWPAIDHVCTFVPSLQGAVWGLHVWLVLSVTENLSTLLNARVIRVCTQYISVWTLYVSVACALWVYVYLQLFTEYGRLAMEQSSGVKPFQVQDLLHKDFRNLQHGWLKLRPRIICTFLMICCSL